MMCVYVCKQHAHQQMIIVRHPGAGDASVPAQQATPQPQLIVSAATNSEQMQLLQQQNNIGLAPTSSPS